MMAPVLSTPEPESAPCCTDALPETPPVAPAVDDDVDDIVEVEEVVELVDDEEVVVDEVVVDDFLVDEWVGVARVKLWVPVLGLMVVGTDRLVGVAEKLKLSLLSVTIPAKGALIEGVASTVVARVLAVPHPNWEKPPANWFW